MKSTAGIYSLISLLALAGCDGSSNGSSNSGISGTNGNTATDEASNISPDSAPDEGSADVLLDQFASATFVSAALFEYADTVTGLPF